MRAWTINPRARTALTLSTLALTGLVACGSPTAKISVSLATSTSELFDPYAATSGLSKIRVSVDGPDAYDDATLDLAGATLTQRDVAFESFPAERAVDVVAQGYDEFGNLVAFGTKRAVRVDGDVSVELGFRPNLAFVAHRQNARQQSPGSVLYVFDIASRSFLRKLSLPSAAASARGVFPRGGDALLVTWDEAGAGKLGVLSAKTGEWSVMALPFTHDLAVASPESALGAAAGGGAVSIIDLDTQTVLKSFSIGGTALDGVITSDGRRALFALDVSPGVLVVDLSEACTATLEQGRCIRALDPIPGAAGVALASDGVTAFLTSRTRPSIFAYDLSKLRGYELASGFPLPTGAAAYSEQIKGVLAIQEGDVGAPRVLTYVVPGAEGLSLGASVPTLLRPTDIAADPSGRRLFAVAAGTSTGTAGLTVLETAVDPEGKVSVAGSSGYYPTDPDDTYMDGDFEARQRYQPTNVGILYGR
ncbi:hypothetical protein L6R52_39165 [Myxococcota bacterium]|nr:hypothetical protein [Myxococcota bacterium]